MGIKCPKCNTDNPDTQKFCGECGTQIKSVQTETKTLRPPTKDSVIGEVISEKYKLLEELGSGGMGVVYKAEQTKPVKRSVALKIIKLGMDTKQVVARFETERQALAVMNHPNIAKVFDGGATETGRPYFAMELVHGIPITEYCDKYKLSTQERLELYIHVCGAVQHAHQKGIIHRDLKPSNVLVSLQENKPVPKIIDFGIAKATEHRLTERTLFTEQGQLIGTPEYMSPEQAEMSGLDVDTRTDIYSLGVILYELLVGVLPFDPKTLREAGFGEIQRIISEIDPPKVSTRLSGLGDNNTSIAEQRRTDVATLHKQLKGDLDWITMKAMSKDRTQRYASASELSIDIIRYLKNEPILASPPSTLYRIGKYIKRHKFGVVATALVILAMLIGIAGMSVGLLKATKAEKKAREEAKTAQEVSGFLLELFEVSDPSEARGNTITAREIMDKAAKKIEETLKDQPEIQARLMVTIGKVFGSLGLYSRAESLLEQALIINRQTLGDEHPETLSSIDELAANYWHQNRINEAETLYLELVEICRKKYGEEHPKTLKAYFDLASVYYMQNRFTEMEQLSLKTLKSQRRILGEDHPNTLETMSNLASLYWLQKRYDEAEPIALNVLEVNRRVLGEDHPETLRAMHNLATIYELQKHYNKAEPLYIKAIELKYMVLGEDHPQTIISVFRLASMYQKQSRYGEAEIILLNHFHKLDASLGKEHKRTKAAILRLIGLYKAWGKQEKIEEYSKLLKDEVKNK